MNADNFPDNISKLKYYFFRFLKYINIFFSKLSKPSKLKILQWKLLISLFNENNCKTFLEFGSGRSTIFFLKNLSNCKEFLSINPINEIKYTNIVREKYKSLNITKSSKIINSEIKIKSFGSKTAIDFIYPFSNMYDLIYIDGPSKKINGSNLIINILNGSIKTKIFFFDGRHDMIDELVKIFKKINYKYKITHWFLLNCTVLFVL